MTAADLCKSQDASRVLHLSRAGVALRGNGVRASGSSEHGEVWNVFESGETGEGTVAGCGEGERG